MSEIYNIIDKQKLDIVSKPISEAHGLPNECYISKEYTLIERKKLLELVPNDLYEELEQIDLNKPINKKDDEYDSVMCVGTFTFGHVKPPALEEFIRITKNDGFICFTINEGIHEEYGFDKKIEQLKEQNKWKEIKFFKSDYIASKDVNAWLGLYQVIK